MPDVSRFMIRAALLWLLAGGVTGAVLLAEKGIPLWAGAWILLPMHINTVIFGWMIQFVLGVAYWMLPKYREEPLRGPVAPARFVCLGFNAGLVLTFPGHLGLFPVLFLGTGYALIFASVVVMAILVYPRVLTYRGGY